MNIESAKVPKKIPSLDGLRALSILLVLFDHGAKSLPTAVTDTFVYSIFSNSQLGVRIFFIISGYLITRLLLEETAKHGDINLKKFYIKRILRIFPVFYLYILVMVLLQVFVGGVFHWQDILIASLFLWNMKLLLVGSSPYEQEPGLMREPTADGWRLMGHFWTLAMEEQFYLVWPFVMKKVKQAKNLMKICVWVIVLMPAIRVLAYYTLPEVRGQIDNMIFTSSDSLLLGCLLALLEQSAYRDRMLNWLTKTWMVVISVIFIFIISPFLVLKFRGMYDLTVGMTLTNIGISSLLLFSIYKQNSWHRFLNLKFIATVGVLSYSIYIWQQLFLFTDVKWLFIDIGSTRFYLNRFPQNIFFVILISCLSYYLYEKRILKYKNRIK